MKYVVIWSHTTLECLAQIWTDAPHRDQVTEAAAEIDRVLAADPAVHGESREGTTRVLIYLPLGVEYDVDDEQRRVQVNAVWRIRKRNE